VNEVGQAEHVQCPGELSQKREARWKEVVGKKLVQKTAVGKKTVEIIIISIGKISTPREL
jgi:hypothetical protein